MPTTSTVPGTVSAVPTVSAPTTPLSFVADAPRTSNNDYMIVGGITPASMYLRYPAVQNAAVGGVASQPPAVQPAINYITPGTQAPQPGAPGLPTAGTVAPPTPPTPGTTGGGSAELAPLITKLAQALSSLAAALGPIAAAQSGNANVQAGGQVSGPQGGSGCSPAGTAGGGPGKSDTAEKPDKADKAGGCSSKHATDPASDKPGGPPPAKAPDKPGGPPQKDAPPPPGGPSTPVQSPVQAGPSFAIAPLTVKGKGVSEDQRKNIQIVLETGKKMGASRKVLEAAVQTVIQESTAHNDASVSKKDLDSEGLFQQRPSAGWGTPAQVNDPVHASTKFFEKAIANDKKNPGFSKAQLAQSVQISAFPDAYAKWDGEGKAAVDAFLGQQA